MKLNGFKTNMKTKFRYISPEMAGKLLEHNHPNNRAFKDKRINQYEFDLNNDLWVPNHQGMAVDEDGYLIDGQNRAAAIVNSGEGMWCWFFTGVPRKGIEGADCGASRSVGDIARISDRNILGGNNQGAGMIRQILNGVSPTRQTFSHRHILDCAEKWRDAIAFQYDCFHGKNKRSITQAGVRATVARAFMCLPKDKQPRIREFCDSLLSGLIGNHKTDTAVIRLRNWLIDISNNRRGATMDTRIVYAKCQTALQAFLDYTPLDKLYETKQELFPLPGEEVVAAKE